MASSILFRSLLHVPSIILTSCLLFMYFTHGWCARPLSDWNRIDYDAVDKEWEQGDEQEELVSEYESISKQAAQFQGKEFKNMKFDINNPNMDVLEEMNLNPGSPVMMFVTLQGSSSKEDIVRITSKWKELLLTGGVDVNCYDIEQNRVLVSLQKGWKAKELLGFLLEQEVAEVEWDQKKYLPGEEIFTTNNKTPKKSKASKASKLKKKTTASKKKTTTSKKKTTASKKKTATSKTKQLNGSKKEKNEIKKEQKENKKTQPKRTRDEL